jgi:hypothetical protein
MLGVALLLGGIGLGESIVVILLALLGVVVLVRDRPDYERSAIISFFLVFALLSPFYSPYTRLLLPLMCSAYILAGIGLTSLVQDRVPLIKLCPLRYQLLSMGLISLALGGLILSTGIAARGHTYGGKTGFIAAVDEIVPLIPENSEIAVIGEPAAVFYLRNHGFNARHLDKLADMYNFYKPGMTVYIACGRYACRWQKNWYADYPGAFTRIASGAVREVSEIRLFDDLHPWNAVRWATDKRHDYDLQLFRVDVPPRLDGIGAGNRR